LAYPEIPKTWKPFVLKAKAFLEKLESMHFMVLVLEGIMKLFGAEMLPISYGTGFCLET
jgi:hypothetical protein